jgi:hypothetical protein
MIANEINSQNRGGNLKVFWRAWAFPLSIGLASGGLMVAILHDPVRESELTVSASLCRILEQGEWKIAPSPDGTCRVSASYRKKDRFWSITQGDRTIRINEAGVLTVRDIHR